MGIAAVLDKAGPALATGILLAVLTAAASTVVAFRDLSAASAVRFGNIATELERLRGDLESFRAPGGRFTAHDGDRHWQRMDQLDARIREQENRGPRLTPALEKMEERVRTLEQRIAVLEGTMDHLEAEQERLCQRLQACRNNSR